MASLRDRSYSGTGQRRMSKANQYRSLLSEIQTNVQKNRGFSRAGQPVQRDKFQRILTTLSEVLATVAMKRLMSSMRGRAFVRPSNHARNGTETGAKSYGSRTQVGHESIRNHVITLPSKDIQNPPPPSGTVCAIMG